MRKIELISFKRIYIMADKTIKRTYGQAHKNLIENSNVYELKKYPNLYPK